MKNDSRQSKINDLKDEISHFEIRFCLSSEDAWQAYHRGELGDDMDIMEWMALYENLLEYQVEQRSHLKSS